MHLRQIDVDGLVALCRFDAEHRREDIHGVGAEVEQLDVRSEAGEAIGRAVDAIDAQQRDDRSEGRRCVRGRARDLAHHEAPLPSVRAHLLEEARAADANLASEQDGIAHVENVANSFDLGSSPDQPRPGSRTGPRSLGGDRVERDRRVDALERDRIMTAGHEGLANHLDNQVGDDDRVRRRCLLEASREVGGESVHLAVGEVEVHRSVMNGDAHRQAVVGRTKVIDECQPCSNSPTGVVAERRRMTEQREHAVADPARHCSAVGFHDRRAAAVISLEHPAVRPR